jgi:uridine phosphorylase
MNHFKPSHINLTKEQTNNRIFIIPGSNGRSKYIAEHFLEKNYIVNESSRGHNVYLGNIENTNIKIGIVSTGMGCPSLDIIVNELILMGVTTLIRIGTCGSFDLNKCPLGSTFIGTGAVRDESTSSNYIPIEVPSIANIDLVYNLKKTANNLNLNYNLGLIHTKDSLFVREYGIGPLKRKSKEYMESLKQYGVLVSEMESSHLFVLGQLNNVKTASVLSVIGGEDAPFGLDDIQKKNSINNSIKLVIEMIKNYN